MSIEFVFMCVTLFLPAGLVLFFDLLYSYFIEPKEHKKTKEKNINNTINKYAFYIFVPLTLVFAMWLSGEDFSRESMRPQKITTESISVKHK